LERNFDCGLADQLQWFLINGFIQKMLNKEIDKQESLCNLTNYQSISTWVDVGQASLTLSWIVPLPIHWEQHFLHPTKSSHWILWCAQTLVALELEQPDEG